MDNTFVLDYQLFDRLHQASIRQDEASKRVALSVGRLCALYNVVPNTEKRKGSCKIVQFVPAPLKPTYNHHVVCKRISLFTRKEISNDK